jgi:hypothetical protein
MCTTNMIFLKNVLKHCSMKLANGDTEILDTESAFIFETI